MKEKICTRQKWMLSEMYLTVLFESYVSIMWDLPKGYLSVICPAHSVLWCVMGQVSTEHVYHFTRHLFNTVTYWACYRRWSLNLWHCVICSEFLRRGFSYFFLVLASFFSSCAVMIFPQCVFFVILWFWPPVWHNLKEKRRRHSPAPRRHIAKALPDASLLIPSSGFQCFIKNSPESWAPGRMQKWAVC